MSKIKQISARDVTDSKGEVTIQATVTLESGKTGNSSPPPSFFRGMSDKERLDSVRKAIELIENSIAPSLLGLDSFNQELVDSSLMSINAIDNNESIAKIAILSTSLANAKAAAEEKDIPLYEHLCSLAKTMIIYIRVGNRPHLQLIGLHQFQKSVTAILVGN